MGQQWAQQGNKKRMPKLNLPGYEKLVLLQPLDTPPNAMKSVADNNNNKRSRDSIVYCSIVYYRIVCYSIVSNSIVCYSIE